MTKGKSRSTIFQFTSFYAWSHVLYTLWHSVFTLLHFFSWK